MKVMLIGFAACALTSCVWQASTPSGIRELNKGYVGLASVNRQDTPFHELEREVEKQKTLRIQFSGGEQ